MQKDLSLTYQKDRATVMEWRNLLKEIRRSAVLIARRRRLRARDAAKRALLRSESDEQQRSESVAISRSESVSVPMTDANARSAKHVVDAAAVFTSTRPETTITPGRAIERLKHPMSKKTLQAAYVNLAWERLIMAEELRVSYGALQLRFKDEWHGW